MLLNINAGDFFPTTVAVSTRLSSIPSIIYYIPGEDNAKALKHVSSSVPNCFADDAVEDT